MLNRNILGAIFISTAFFNALTAAETNDKDVAAVEAAASAFSATAGALYLFSSRPN